MNVTVHRDTSTEMHGLILTLTLTLTTTKNVLKKESIPKIDQYWTFYLSVLIRGANIHKLATLSYL